MWHDLLKMYTFMCFRYCPEAFTSLYVTPENEEHLELILWTSVYLLAEYCQKRCILIFPLFLINLFKIINYYRCYLFIYLLIVHVCLSMFYNTYMEFRGKSEMVEVWSLFSTTWVTGVELMLPHLQTCSYTPWAIILALWFYDLFIYLYFFVNI